MRLIMKSIKDKIKFGNWHAILVIDMLNVVKNMNQSNYDNLSNYSTLNQVELALN